jgi:alpha-tubulin suppressor-like RCC1 family protein
MSLHITMISLWLYLVCGKHKGWWFMSRFRKVLILLLLLVPTSALGATAGVEEAKSIARLYSAAFDRLPKIDGLNFWVKSYEAGRSLVSIAGDFYKSPEFTNKYGVLSDQQYVEQLYENVLGRPGKQGGVIFWTNHLSKGVSRAKVLAEFSDSPENIAKTSEIFSRVSLVNGLWTLEGRTIKYISRLAAGGEYLANQGSSCAIDDTGVRCWGDLGQSAVPIDLSNPYHIDIDRHICVLDDSGVRCWGNNEYGQTDVPDDLVNPYYVSVGGDGYTCVLHEPGVRCWGNNLYGQTDVPRLINPRQLSSDSHSCAIDDTGVVCWGSGDFFGELDIPTGIVNPRQVEVRLGNTCVLDDNGVHCWGQVMTDPPFKPINPRDMVMGNEFACVLDDAGVRCWGHVPGGVPEDLVNPREIAAADSHWCVLDDTGVHCQPYSMGLGKSHVPENLVNPREVRASVSSTCAIDDLGMICWARGFSRYSDIINPRAIAMGQNHSCVIGDKGISCSGSNLYGGTSVPPGLVNPVEVSVGVWHSCAIDDYGVHCWGGHPWFDNEPPSNLIEPHGLVTASYPNCVLDYGIVKCWGTTNDPAPKPKNQKYSNARQIQLGWGGLCVLDDNGVQCTQNQSEVPTNLVDPTMISMGGNACAIDANGVTCWGPNDYGQSNAPKGLVNPRQISVGLSHACALDDKGVHCWGSGEGDAANAPTDLKFADPITPQLSHVTYSYKGNYFNEFDGEPSVFSTSDRVIGQFTINCRVAHSSGDCMNLPYADYFERGAIDIGSISFSAGPARLPASEDSAQIQSFFFSTDSTGHITDWDIILFVNSPLLNVDTDSVNGGIDSAAALGGGAVLYGNPGTWSIVENPI